MADYALALSDAEIRRYRMMAEQAAKGEADAWRAAGIVAGARVADVGCGPGATLVVMAEIVGEGGSVIGVDADPAAIAAAVEMIESSGVANASARVGAADATGLPPGTFDVAVLRHVLAHNGGREPAIVDHLASLVRPGGCVYLADVELTAARLLPADPDATDMMERYAAFHCARGNDPRIGLRLGTLLKQAGLEVVEHCGRFNIFPVPPGMRPPPWTAREAMIAEGHASAGDVARWQAALERYDAAAEPPISFIPLFTAIGRRPG